MPTLRCALSVLPAALLAVAALAAVQGAAAAPKTVCTVTINSSDERDVLERQLPRDRYRVVELVQQGRRDWLADACRRGVTCDALVVSGHFDAGTEFYSDRFDEREYLTMHELQRASCSASCSGLFAQLKEVYLFGCNTLQSEPKHAATAEVVRSLLRAGRAPAEAEAGAAQLTSRYGQSNRERMRHVFKDVPVLYGFSSQAPLGRYAGPLLERYLQSAPDGEIAGGRQSPTLLGLFAPSSMVAIAGLTDADPHADFRRDMCRLADEAPSDARKLAFVHQVLQRDVTEVRMFLEHLEHYAASLGPAQRRMPEVAAALSAIERDHAARDRYLEFARDADEASVQARMMALAQTLGWLTPAQERAEFVRMVADRMARGRLGGTEVDLVCAARRDRDPELARLLLATGAPRPDRVAHAAALACLGSAEAHQRTVRALASPRDEEVAIAQIYLRHRALAGAGEARAIAANIARMPAGGAQARALQALGKQHLTDPQTVQEIARLFPQVRSLEVQRAIAGVLIRSDTRALERAELARTLRQHRLKSPDGSDVIDVLIRLLQST